MKRDAILRARLSALLLAVAVIVAACCSCATVKGTSIVGGGAAIGAGAGSLAGPVGTFAGAAIGAAVAHLVADNEAMKDRETATAGAPRMPPPWFDRLGLPWQLWLAILAFIYARRAHLADALTGKAPRGDAILRALCIRTHKSPRPMKGGAS